MRPVGLACSVIGCSSFARARDWCHKHYMRWYRTGSPHKVRTQATHGHSPRIGESRTYSTWHNMKQRCLNPRVPNWKNYGGRGITIHPAWIENFENFLADVGDRPEGMTLDRIDNNGNYEPGNIRWATVSQQNSNRRKKQR